MKIKIGKTTWYTDEIITIVKQIPLYIWQLLTDKFNKNIVFIDGKRYDVSSPFQKEVYNLHKKLHDDIHDKIWTKGDK